MAIILEKLDKKEVGSRRGSGWSQEEEVTLLKLIASDTMLEEMERILGRSRMALRRHFTRYHLNPIRHFTKITDRVIKKMLNNGKRLSQIADHFWVQEKQLAEYLYEKGIYTDSYYINNKKRPLLEFERTPCMIPLSEIAKTIKYCNGQGCYLREKCVCYIRNLKNKEK